MNEQPIVEDLALLAFVFRPKRSHCAGLQRSNPAIGIAQEERRGTSDQGVVENARNVGKDLMGFWASNLEPFVKKVVDKHVQFEKRRTNGNRKQEGGGTHNREMRN